MTPAAFVDEVWAPRARGRLAAKTWERDHAGFDGLQQTMLRIAGATIVTLIAAAAGIVATQL